MVLWHVRDHGIDRSSSILQTRYQVSCSHFVRITHHRHCKRNSIQTWALNEAKARMEARGEKTSYPWYLLSVPPEQLPCFTFQSHRVCSNPNSLSKDVEANVLSASCANAHYYCLSNLSHCKSCPPDFSRRYHGDTASAINHSWVFTMLLVGLRRH